MKKLRLHYIKGLTQGLVSTSLLISIFFAADKVLGFIRQILIVKAFGNSSAADAYYAANNLPDALTSLIAGGVTLAFIPVLAKTIELKNTKKTWKLFNTVFNLGLLFILFISAAIWWQGDVLVSSVWGITPGFTKPVQGLTLDLMRLNLIAGIFFTASGLIMAGLQAHKRFFLTLLAPLLYTVVQILALLFLVPQAPLRIGMLVLPTAGLGIYGLVYGIIISGLVHLMVQLPGLLRLGWRWQPTIDISDPEFRSTFSLLAVRLITMFFIQLMFIARDNFGSRLGSGAVSALGYGWFIMLLPETLIGTAIGTSMFPTLAGLIAEKQYGEFRMLIKKSVRVVLLLCTSISVVTCLLAPFLLKYVNSLLHSSLNVNLLLLALIGFMVGLSGQSLLEILARAYYALEDGKTYLYATIARFLILLLVTIILLPTFGVLGVALADSIATTLVAAYLYKNLLAKNLVGSFAS